MELTNLMFAIIGHVLASVLYIINRFKSPPKAVVDRSSILERKEEIIQLWESKMMANEEPASPEESPKEAIEETKTPAAHNGDAHKMSNGIVTHEEANVKEKTDADQMKEKDPSESEQLEEKAIKPPEGKAEVAEEVIKKEIKEEIQEQSKENGECLKQETELCNSETVETKEEQILLTSTLQQTSIVTEMKSVEKIEETVTESTVMKSVEVAVVEESQDDFEELERRIEEEESLLHSEKTQETKKETETVEEKVEKDDHKMEEEVKEKEESAKVQDVEQEPPSLADNSELAVDSLEEESHCKGHELNEAVVLETTSEVKIEKTAGGILMNGVGEDDAYRPLADFLPPVDDNIEEDIATSETAFAQNGESEEKTFDDHFVLDTRELVSPASDTKDPTTGKKSRIHTLGVQKTEQPYSTCTTETKIAMEIREMREREEELKLMRERQAQISPAPPPQKLKTSPSPTPTATRTSPLPKAVSPVGYGLSNATKMNTPGYRVSSVFGHRAVAQQAKDESKFNRNFNKESPVEKEIRLAKDREEELRRQKGLPPREDDSYVKPSQVKSSQAKVFGKMSNAETSRLLATAKIQHEIEEQTQREMALRESGHIQTISTERTDSKVTKLKSVDLSPECLSPTFQNGNSPIHTNGNGTTYSNGHISPENGGYRRSSPSPTGSLPSSYSMNRNILPPSNNNKGTISMQKFIASRGKETTFSAPRNGPFSSPRSPDYQDVRTIPDPGKLKRTVSVESKIQQEIMEMKMREEELKMLHSGNFEKAIENGDEYDSNPRSSHDFQNGQSNDSDIAGPRRNNLIAQWEQRIQNAEGKA